jgi:hypothetical protein
VFVVSLCCSGLFWAVLACSGLFWAVLCCAVLGWAVQTHPQTTLKQFLCPHSTPKDKALASQKGVFYKHQERETANHGVLVTLTI